MDDALVEGVSMGAVGWVGVGAVGGCAIGGCAVGDCAVLCVRGLVRVGFVLR